MKEAMAVYPGTFDPFTRGHEDLVRRAARLFDRIVVAIAASTGKGPIFSLDERVEIAREVLAPFANVEVVGFDGLLMDFLHARQARLILRGLRAVSDFEYEFQMALINRKLDPSIETVFMMTSDNYAPVSSRFIKEIARYGGDVNAFVTPRVARKLKEKFKAAPERGSRK